jgi:hypothetical protein
MTSVLPQSRSHLSTRVESISKVHGEACLVGLVAAVQQTAQEPTQSRASLAPRSEAVHLIAVNFYFVHNDRYATSAA